MIDYTQLRAAALACTVPHAGAADDRFFELAKPAALVALIDELHALRAKQESPCGKLQVV